jgi:putative transposase
MPKKRFSAEQIVTVLRQIEVLMAQGKSAHAVRAVAIGVKKQTRRRNLGMPPFDPLRR